MASIAEIANSAAAAIATYVGTKEVATTAANVEQKVVSDNTKKLLIAGCITTFLLFIIYFSIPHKSK